MTTGNEILRRALSLMNDASPDSWLDAQADAGLYSRALCALNQAYCDLWYCENGDASFTELAGLDQLIELSARSRDDVLPYGVAMLLCAQQGDDTREQLFASVYSQKRAAVAKKATRIQDVLPRGDTL